MGRQSSPRAVDHCVSGSTLGSVRALVCEDEPLARRALREYLKGVDWVDLVGEAADGREAVRSIHKLEPDLVFLDVRMPELSGLQVLEMVTHRAAVVFTTAYDEYAVSAFELGAVDYLVKPFGRERLLQTLSRVRVRLLGEGAASGDQDDVPRSPAVRRLFARHRGTMVPVRTADIIRVDATAGGARLVTDSGIFDMDATLGEVEQRLDPSDFVRIHRSHIVNLGRVTGIRSYDERRLEVCLTDGSTLVASRHGSRLLRNVTG